MIKKLREHRGRSNRLLRSLRSFAMTVGLFRMASCVLGIFAVLLLSRFFFSSPAIASEYEFMQTGKSLEWTMRVYHTWINDAFNQNFKALSENLSTNGHVNSELITAPARDANGNRSCASDSLSTYCLAEKVTKAYIQYRANLLSRRGNLADALLCQSQNDNEPAITVDVAGTIAGTQQSFIDSEIASAKVSLDVALAAYNEFQTAYPMHKKYEEIIAELEKYRDEFSDIRKNIEAYPVKFVNVSTPNCT